MNVLPRGLHTAAGPCFQPLRRRAGAAATVANAARFALSSVTRPGQLQGRAQLQAAADDLSLTECDERSRDLDASLFRAHPDDMIEGVVMLRTAGSRSRLRDRANVNLLCSQNFGPADRRGKKMRVAEGDVGDGNLFADVLRLGDGDAFVSQCRAADLGETAVLDEHALSDAEPVADLFEGIALTRLGTLAITDMHGRNVLCAVLMNGDGGADAGIHASAEEHDGAVVFSHFGYLVSDA